MLSESPSTAFTPKQVALALGVSESSVKRWCDNGKIRTSRTAGGHRKLPLSAVVEWVRETGQEITNPSALGMVAVSARRKPGEVQDELYDALLAGDESTCRSLVLGLYQNGATIVDLGDQLIGPVFNRIGDDWEAKTISVHQERRSCEVMMATLHELRRWLPEAPADAPLALTATPMRDFSQPPIRLVELVLKAMGWRTEMAGSGLPLEEIRDAVELRKPQLVCLSATHLADPDEYVQQHNRVLFEEAQMPPIIIGGGAFACQQAGALRCALFGARLADLAEWLANYPNSSEGTDN